MEIQLNGLVCPSCGAGINMNLNGRTTVFCPYCGIQIAVNDGSTTINHNININERYTNDAAVEMEHRIDKENERQHKERKRALIVFVAFYAFLLGVGFYFATEEERETRKSIRAGMIQAGQSSSEMEGKNYNAVLEQLEAAGFTEIKTIDLDDAGWFKNKSDTVDSVSIGGDTSFEDTDFFEPDAKVVITYH